MTSNAPASRAKALEAEPESISGATLSAATANPDKVTKISIIPKIFVTVVLLHV
jgi:hypothetical protein